MKIVLFDIETPRLEADFGQLLCFAWKELGLRKIESLRIDTTKAFRKSRADDSEIVRKAALALSNADILISWYGRRFDVPFLNSRLTVHKLPPLPPIPHVDAWFIARYKLHLHSNRLKSVSEFLGIEEKTPLLPDVWMRATVGHRDGIDYVEEHCRQDVRILEQAYLRLRPLCHDHPNLALLVEPPKDGKPAPARCPICGAKDSCVRRRERIARVSKTELYQCTKCGGWSTGPPVREKIFIR